MLLISQGTELVGSMVAEESVEQRGELLVLLSQGGSQEDMEIGGAVPWSAEHGLCDIVRRQEGYPGAEGVPRRFPETPPG